MTSGITISDDDRKLGRTCRHFDGRATIVGGAACAIGHPICKIVIAANGGDRTGTAYMYPCRPGPLRKADCPDYDPKTDQEIAAAKAAMSERMDRFVKGLAAVSGMRATMVEGRIERDRFDCPWCNAHRGLHVTCAIDVNNHISARCQDCGEGFIE